MPLNELTNNTQKFLIIVPFIMLRGKEISYLQINFRKFEINLCVPFNHFNDRASEICPEWPKAELILTRL